MDGPCCQAFVFDRVGAGEWLVLMVVILVVFGPRRLPELARKLGRALEQLRHAADQFRDQLMSLDQADAGGAPPPQASPTGTAARPRASDGPGDQLLQADSDRQTLRLAPASSSSAVPAPAADSPATKTPAAGGPA